MKGEGNIMEFLWYKIKLDMKNGGRIIRKNEDGK
jgi:hypothetical protein